MTMSDGTDRASRELRAKVLHLEVNHGNRNRIPQRALLRLRGRNHDAVAFEDLTQHRP
jgi:hypothetical protein